MHTYWRTACAALWLVMMPVTATAATAASEPIVTMLVDADDPIEFPDPICSKCKIIVVEDEAAATSRAEILISYPTDAPGFVGRVEVTVWLDSDERRRSWIEGVSLEPGDEELLVAEAGSDWSWERVRFVWLRFVPE